MTKHTPVLLEAVLKYLNPRPGESYLDVTAGYGGHAQAILQRTNKPEAAVLVDRDARAVEALKNQFGALGGRIVHQDFLRASADLAQEGRRFDMILADLGVSSPQLDDPDRGFSFRQAGPLDMRMDNRQRLRSNDIVNAAPEAELSRIFTDYGEEPKAQQIARQIVQRRPITNTDQLADIAAKVWPRGSRMHPATRLFQALRIAVNDELYQLKQSLPIWHELLADGGRLAIISFHSLEDRVVKQFLQEHSFKQYGGTLQVLTKKPIVGDNHEVLLNPRARSAKLRVSRKNKNKRKDR